MSKSAKIILGVVVVMFAGVLAATLRPQGLANFKSPIHKAKPAPPDYDSVFCWGHNAFAKRGC